MGMRASTVLKPGVHVLVPWGLDEPREAVVLEVWGDPEAPSHIRVQLLQSDAEGDEAALLLLNPGVVTTAA